MNAVAVSLPTLTIYWNGIVIALGILAWFCLSYALYTANGGRAAAMWVLFPIALGLGLVLSRALHWYCHMEQYTSFLSAVTDYTSGSFVIPGMLVGVVLAVLLVKAFGYCESAAPLFDALAPGAALGLAFIRLGALFTNSCRAKIVITSPVLKTLPIAAPFTTSSGVEYRFASFFVEFLLLLILCAALLSYTYRLRDCSFKGETSPHGHTAMMFIVFYGAISFVLDSTRYDKSFIPICGFVSFVQIFIAVTILAVLIYYSIASVRANGRRWYHIPLWIAYVVTLGITGFLEYWVQRHGDLYLSCYSAMTLSMLGMALVVRTLARSCIERD